MKFKEYIDKKKITLSGFAENIGVAVTTIAKIYHGQSFPSIKTAWKIEKETDGNVTLYDWLDGPINKK